jgi:hypothetical protein
MEAVKHHHHFRPELIEPSDRVALCERYVIDLLLSTSLPDSKRESSIAWELKHSAGVTQMARLLARKRGLPMDTCTVGSLLHDIYVIMDGKYKDHAHLGAPIAVSILSEVGGFEPEEADQVFRTVYYHSDKDDWSDDPFKEFGKDADILDIFLYPGPYAEYLMIKSIPVLSHYLMRAKKIWAELRLPADPRYNLLENYSPSWFEQLFSTSSQAMEKVLAYILQLASFPKETGWCPPSFCLLPSNSIVSSLFEFYGTRPTWGFYGNRDSWEAFLEGSFDSELSSSHEAMLKEMRQSISGGARGVITKWRSTSTDWKLEYYVNSRQIVNDLSNARAIVFWPLADLYEIIDSPSNSARLRELGVID